MGTRSRIGILIGNNTVESVYCHWDGYPECVGKMLKESYSEIEVSHLISNGDFSGLKRNPKAIEFYAQRGDKDVGYIEHAEDEWPDYGQEYEYLLTREGWKYRGSRSSKWLFL